MRVFSFFILFCASAYSAVAIEIKYQTDFEKVKEEAERCFNNFFCLSQSYNNNPSKREKSIFRADIDQLGERYNEIRHDLVKKYSWAIPNDEALMTIKTYGPIFELGAGTGYWAKLLNEFECEVVAVDNGQDNGTPLAPSKFWTKILMGNEEMIREYPNHTLFICWPDPRTEAGGKVLKLYKGSHVLYVGYNITKKSPYMADSYFYKILSEEFRLVKEVAIPNWPGNNDKLYVFERL